MLSAVLLLQMLNVKARVIQSETLQALILFSRTFSKQMRQRCRGVRTFLVLKLVVHKVFHFPQEMALATLRLPAQNNQHPITRRSKHPDLLKLRLRDFPCWAKACSRLAIRQRSKKLAKALPTGLEPLEAVLWAIGTSRVCEAHYNQ